MNHASINRHCHIFATLPFIELLYLVRTYCKEYKEGLCEAVGSRKRTIRGEISKTNTRLQPHRTNTTCRFSGWHDESYFMGSRADFETVQRAFREKGMEYRAAYIETPECYAERIATIERSRQTMAGESSIDFKGI